MAMKTSSILLLAILLLAFPSCKKDKEEDKKTNTPSNQKCVDPCAGQKELIFEGQTYKLVGIDCQCWFAENLNVNAPGSRCFDNDEENCKTYGRLYTWEAATKACPPGWHLPTDAEWSKMSANFGSLQEAGGALKSTSNLWKAPNAAATNSSGFNALPGADYHPWLGWGELGEEAVFWTATQFEDIEDEVWIRSLYFDFGAFMRSNNFKTNSYSCRCVKD